MRVAMIAPSAGPRTGSRRYADRMIALARGLHEVVLLAPGAAPPRVDLVHALDAKHVLGWTPPPEAAFLADLHDDYWTGAARYPAFDSPARAWRRVRNRPRYLALLHRADAVVVHGSAVARAVPHERVVLLPIPAEPPVPDGISSPPAAATAQEAGAGTQDAWRSPTSPLRVLFAGRDALRKGLPVLGEALRMLRGRGIATELRVAGGDWPHLRAASRWWCRGLGARFDGDLDRPAMRAAYVWADVAALPSYTEAFGLVAQEALLAGRPVVASRVGGLEELLADLPGAQLAPPGDAAALAEALAQVASDRGGWRARAEASAKMLLAARTPEAALDALDRAYAIALAHAARGRGRGAASAVEPAGRGRR